MKIQVLTATAVLALFASTGASAGSLSIDVTNEAYNALAVGGAEGSYNSTAAGGGASSTTDIWLSVDGRARAGSVLVANTGLCGCNGATSILVDNYSVNALAVGNASAGSTTIRF